MVALVGLAALSTALHAVLAGWSHGPFVFMDELGYERMAKSFAATGHFSLFGKAGLAYSPLYPVVLSPIYALTSSMHTAYEWAKVENAVLISLAVFPIYGIARSVLSRPRAVGVAALSLVAPLMLYSGLEMSENLAYPLCLASIWTMLRAVRRPSLGNDALLLGAILVASAARLQLIVLVPAALTALLVFAFAEGRLAAVRRTLSEHWLLFGVSAVALVGGLVRTAMNGGNLPLAGRYANAGTSHASPLRVFELFFQHLAELDFAVGVIPFAAALLAGYALVRYRFPRRALVFGSVAVASTFWILLEVAYDAAAYDSTSNARPTTATAFAGLPRIHERYLIYLMPFFFVALVAALPLFRKRFPGRVHLAIAAVVTALPALIPFRTIINGTTGVDTFGLLAVTTTKHGGRVPVTHATLAIVALSGLLALVYLLATDRPFPSLAVVFTVVALLYVSSLELRGQAALTSARSLGLPAQRGWVDRAVGTHVDVSLVGGDGVGLNALRQTAFWNGSIARVYYTCDSAFGSDFGEQRATGEIRARYAVVPASFVVSGRVLARDPAGKLVLVAPSGGALRIPANACPS